MTFRLRLRLALASLLAAGSFSLSGLHAALRLETGVPGNIFLLNESVRIPATATGNRLEWTVTDYFGQVVRQGYTQVSGGKALIQPSPNRRGYFELEVVEKNNTAVLGRAATRFAILQPIEPAQMTNSPFGVQTHGAQGGPTAAYALLARAGVAHFRDEHYWGSVELAPGRYSYPAQFSSFMAAGAAAGMSPLLTLDWANPFYDYSSGMFTAPHTDRGRAGYGAYGAEVVKRYPKLGYVELWNEYNAGTFVDGPALSDKPGHYAAMLRQARARIRAARPDVKIVAGGTVPVAHGFFRDLFAAGAMPDIDVVSVHPYRSTPAGVELEIAELRELIKRNNGGAEKPIWASEFSRVVESAGDQREAARYLAQIVTLLLSQRVERMYYYHAVDDHGFPHRGLLGRADDPAGAFTPHPAYVAYATAIRQLHGHVFKNRFGGTASSTYAFRFLRGATARNVLWAEAPVTVALRTKSRLSVTDLMGQISSHNPVGGVVRLTLTRDPVFVQGPVEAVLEENNAVLADSVSGFGAKQGDWGWTYGSAPLASNALYDPGVFQPMRWDYSGSNAVCWLLGQWHFVAVEHMHPGSAWAVRRWTSPVAATVKISGKVARGARGDGVNVAVYVDGRRVWGRKLAPGDAADYEVKDVVLRVGSRVDFTVNQAGESSYDSTVFTGRVTRR